MRFEIWNARNPGEAATWRAVHETWPTREVFAHPSYVRLHAAEHDEPLAAYAETPSGAVLYPFLLRPIPGEPRGYDISSAYGYGGAFCSATLDEADAKEFWASFDDFCRSRGVVCEFTRLSLFEDQRLAHPGSVLPRLVNVVRDLRPSEDELWRDFEHKVRKNVNKARRSGVAIEVDEDGHRLDDFLRIYQGTMQRRNAAESYYFPRTFFETIVREMPGCFAFFHALHESRVVSTELVLASVDTLYSYLGGTEQEAFDLRPNDLLKFEVCRWGRARGKQRFVLGGGYGHEDGIFRYKRAFAPGGLMTFSIGTRILDEPRYARLAKGRGDSGFFPAYRAPLAE